MLKLYKIDEDGGLHYHEAWVDDGTITSHWGRAGDRGQTEITAIPPGVEDDFEALIHVLGDSASSGYKPLGDDEWQTLLIEYELDSSWGDDNALRKRHSLEDLMNETLGWTGLGNCDGGSIGSGTMEVCCIVADFDLAKRVISEQLKNTEYSDFRRIYNESE